MAGALDEIYAKIQSYFGEFLQSRDALQKAGSVIDAALSQAQASGSATIGKRTYTLAQLSALKNENEKLLAENADLQGRIMEWKSQYDAVAAGVTGAMDTLSPGDQGFPTYDYPAVEGVGAIPVMVPAGVLIATGAVLASAVFLFLSRTREHVKNLGEAASSITWLLVVGGIGYGLYKYGRRLGLR